MINKVMVVAPHPDNETLGCVGTLLRLAEQGVNLSWLIVTSMTDHYSDAQRQERANTISNVTAAYGFDAMHQLDKPTAELNTLPMSKLIEAIGGVFNDVQPDWALLPHKSDVHSNHRIVFDTCVACSKWFRYPFIKRMMSYEALSETDFSLSGNENIFHPNVFFNIRQQLEHKLEIMAMYPGECGEFPFPRSAEAITAQAKLRGAQVRISRRRGLHAAERAL